MPIQKKFVILGVDHRVQGDATCEGAIEDSDYEHLLDTIIDSNNLDFVGEECRSNPTHAAKIAREQLGEGHHQNVDPLIENEREQFGIGDTGRRISFRSASGGEYLVTCEIVTEQEKREKIWVNRLIESTSTNGLLICGYAHALSVAFRIRELGFEVNVRTYLPLHKLCGHQAQT